MSQKPAFILNLHLPGQDVDMNLAPDKREVLVPAEGAIIGTIFKLLRVLQIIIHFRCIAGGVGTKIRPVEKYFRCE